MSDDADKAPVVAEPAAAPKPKSKGGAKGKKAAPADDVKYESGDIVLARLRGYPPWPARITDPKNLPANVLAQRPKSLNFYCTQFFPAGDFSWLASRDITPLKKHQIDAFITEPHRKASGALREAYQTAQDPTEWDANQSAARRQAEEEAEAEVDEDVDELEEEDDGASKKRKRPAAQKKDAKKAKTTKKAAAETPEVKESKPKESKKESKTAGSEDPDPMASDPDAVKVKDWRHKLQRAFLVKATGLPAAEDMDTFDELFRTIENYENMKFEYLQFSKIGKVLKKIAELSDIPRNDELKITTRATELMNKWKPIVDKAAGEPTKTNGSDDKAAAPAADMTPTATE